jgi:hypothetical protein
LTKVIFAVRAVSFDGPIFDAEDIFSHG